MTSMFARRNTPRYRHNRRHRCRAIEMGHQGRRRRSQPDEQSRVRLGLNTRLGQRLDSLNGQID